MQIECPNYGLVIVNKDISINITEWNTSESAKKEQVLEFIYSNIVLDISELSNLNHDDHLAILISIAEKFDFSGEFREGINNGIDFYECFYDLLKSSPIFKEYESIADSIDENKSQAIDSIKDYKIGFSSMLKGIDWMFKGINSLRPTITMINSFKNIMDNIPIKSIYESNRLISQGVNNCRSELYEALNRVKHLEFPGNFLNADVWKINSIIKTYNNEFALIAKANNDYLATINKYNNFESVWASLSKRLTAVEHLFTQSHAVSLRLYEDQDRLIHKLRNPKEMDDETCEIFLQAQNNTADVGEYFSENESITTFSNASIKTKSKKIKIAREGINSGISKSELFIQDQTASSIISMSTISAEIKSTIREELVPHKRVLDYLNSFLNPKSFSDFIAEFCNFISRENWKGFWIKPGDEFVNSPERYGKYILSAFLQGRFGNIAFVGQEIESGGGFLDILVNFLGKNYIVELKVVGAGWSIGWAKSGIEQLKSYMDLCNEKEAYLIVFDGRKTERGEQLNRIYNIDDCKIYVYTPKIFFDRSRGIT